MIEVPFAYGGKVYTLDVPDNFDTLNSDEQRRLGLEQLQLMYPGVYQPPAPVPTGPVDTSFLGAFQYGADQPTERIADTLETFFGMDASGLRGLVPTDPNYRSATTDFMNAPEGAFNIFGYAPGYIPRAVAEQAGNLGVAMGLRTAGAVGGGALGSVVPGVGTTGGALIGGLTLPTIFEAMQVAGPVLIERMKNNGKTVADATTEDYVAALTAAGFSGVANTFGLLGVGRIKGMISEALTEGTQSVVQQTGETLGTERGLDVSGREVIGEAVLGGATRGSIDTTVDVVKTVPKIPGTLQDATDAVREAISDPAQLAVKTKDTASKLAKRPFASVAEYQNDTAQVESDLRVVDMFNAEKEAIDATEGGTRVADDVVFKNVGDKLRRKLTEAINSLYGANKISNDQRKALLNGPVRRAAQHNREMTAPIDEDVDTEDGRLSGFETDADIIMNLDIDNADKMVLMQGLRDLNTVAENGMKNRKVGFFSKMMERYGSGVGTAAGFSVGGAPGAVAGATAGQVALQNIGQAIDRAFGIGTPPVLRRYNARRRASEVLGRDYGNTPQDLAELIQRMLDEQAVVNTKDTEKAAQDADPSVQALDDYLNAKGAERAGGWLPSAAEHATKNIQLLDPTATVTQEDVLAALGQLLELGVLGPEVVDPLVTERGGRILIPGLLYRITDEALDYKKRQLGLEPSPQSQAAAAQVKQAVDARQAAIQRGIEDNRRFLDDLGTATEADVEMSRADRAKILEAQSNMRLDLGSNPMQKLQRIIDDLAKSGVPQTYIDKYIMPYAARVAQQQQNRRGGGDDISIDEARVVPVPEANLVMQENLGVDPVLPGGNFIDLDNTDGNRPLDITGNTYDRGSIKITPDGRPEFITSDNQTDPAEKSSGKVARVNLAKSKTGWKWVEAPETGSPETIVSVETGGKHFYTLGANFNNPVTLETYPDKPSEPRLRPTTRGEVRLGKKVGSISMRGKIHPVYDTLSIQDKRNNPMRVSTSRPTNVNPADSVVDDRRVSVSLFEGDKLFDKMFNNIRKTVIGMGELAKDTKQFADDYKEFLKANLRFLYDQTPPEYRERAKQWYVGANRLAQGLADSYNLSLEQSTAVLAALSPQLDWFLNYELGRRVIDIHEKHQNTVFDDDMAATGQVFVDGMKEDTARNKKDKAEAQEILDAIKGRRLKDLDDIEAAYFIRFYNETNENQNVRIITPEGDVGDVQVNNDGTPTRGGWNSSFGMIAKGVSVLRNPDRDNIHDKLGEQHKVRSFYNNILDPMSTAEDVTIDTHAVGAALLRAQAGQSQPVLDNFRTAGTSSILGIYGSYAVYADAYRELAKELGILPRELQSITWEAARGLFPDKAKQQKGYKESLDDIWKDVDAGKLSADEARRLIYDTAGGIDRADWEGTQGSGNANRPGGATLVEARQENITGELFGDRVSGGRVDGRTPSDDAGVLSQATEEVDIDPMAVDPAQMELDFDVQSIPRTPAYETGPAQRAVKENLEEAKDLVEIGKPGSPFENGIKDPKQLNAVLTAIGLADKLFVASSRAEMGRIAKRFGGRLPSDTTGLHGFAIQDSTTGKTKAIVVLQQGKGGKVSPQDSEFLAMIHEVAHAIEYSSLKSYSPMRETAVSRPYKVTTEKIQEGSLRDLLNNYLAGLGRDRRDFDNDPIVKEIRAIQANESITVPEGQSGRVRPNSTVDDFLRVYDRVTSDPKNKGKKLRVTREEYAVESAEKIRRRQENYYETAAEFAVDPLLFMMAEPKIAKEKYPNVYKFIKDIMDGKDPKGVDQTYNKDGKLKFYTNPFSIILAAVLSAMAMGEEEERRQPPMMPGGALTPPPGALTL